MSQLQDSPELYQLWQNQLLAEMGIERWTSQSAPVIAISESDWQQFSHHQPVDIALTTSPVIDNDALPSRIDNLAQPVEFEQDIIDSQQTPNNPNHLIVDIHHEVVTGFVIQVMVFNQWVLLADEQYLQADSRQAKLWDNLQRHLKTPIHYCRFPLCDEKLPHASFAAMHNSQIALASFAGFLHRLTYQLSGVLEYQLASLTPLPACLDSQPVERLPYLSEMVADYRFKRQLWQMLTNAIIA